MNLPLNWARTVALAAQRALSNLRTAAASRVRRARDRLREAGKQCAEVPRRFRTWLLALASMPWSLQTAVRRDEGEWKSSNRHRQAMSLSRLERELLFSGEHPVRFVASLVALAGLVWSLIQLLPDDWCQGHWTTWGVSEQLTHFATLWAVQATLAALVYPFVISFVTVFLQRRPAAEVLVHIYILDSGAFATGLSSVSLVLVMAAQYLLIPSYGAAFLPSWTAVDAAWLLLNAALTTNFLFRTIEFLRPEVQDRVIRRYAVGVALPRDMKLLSGFQVLSVAQDRGWIPAPPYYGGKTEPSGPMVHIGPYTMRTGGVQGSIRLTEPARLMDVRLLPLRMVVSTWMTTCAASCGALDDAAASTSDCFQAFRSRNSRAAPGRQRSATLRQQSGAQVAEAATAGPSAFTAFGSVIVNRMRPSFCMIETSP